jgi:tetratricopeptide (TPR) repeat protein
MFLCRHRLIIVAIVLAPFALMARGDEWSDTLSAARAALSSVKHASQQIDLIEKDPTNDYACTQLVELLYNHDRRDLALTLLALGQTRVTHPQRLVDARAALARYELDIPTIERIDREQVDAALARDQIHELRAIGGGPLASDPVFQQCVLPAYAQAFAQSPQDRTLFKLLLQSTTSPEARLSLIRKHLAADANDVDAASSFLTIATDSKDYDAIVATDLPPVVCNHANFAYYQIPALLALHRTEEALAALDQATAKLRAARWKHDVTWISENYAAAGRPDLARAVALECGDPGSLEQLQALARAGDGENACVCLRLLIKDHPPSARVFFKAAAVIRPLDPNAADRTFDQAERFLVKELASHHRYDPLFNISSDLACHYEGMRPRLYEALLPLVTANPEEFHRFFSRIVPPPYRKADIEPTLAFLERHESEFADDWVYLHSRAALLEMLDRPGDALPYYRKAAALQPADKLGRVSMPRPDEGIYRCLMAVKDYAGCETFVKDHMPGILGDFYRITHQWNKAITTYHSNNDYVHTFQLILEHRGQDAAASYVETIPQERRAPFITWLLEARHDTTGLAQAARDRVAARPDDPDLHAQLALRLLKAGRIEEARQEVRKAVEFGGLFGLLSPFSVSAWSCELQLAGGVGLYEIIPLYDDNKILAQLEMDLKSLLCRTNAHRAEYLWQLGGHYSRTNQIAAALEVCQRAAALDPYRASQYREAIAAQRDNH